MFASLGQLISVLKAFVLVKAEDLGLLCAAAKAIANSDDLQVQVQQALVIADILTDYIPGDADDQIVEALQALAHGNEAWMLVDAVRDLLDGKAAPEGTNAPPAFPLVVFIVRIINSFRNKDE